MRRLLALVLAVAACSSSGSSTKGQRGRATFAFRASPGCEDGCDLERNAIATDGAHQILSVSGVDFVSAGSSAPEIATFSKVAGGVEAVTALPGDTDVTLLDAGGAEIDRVTVHVAQVTELQFTRGWSGDGPQILENVPITIAPVTKRDAGRRILLGTDGVHFSTFGTLTSLGAPPPVDPAAPGNIVESLIIQGTAGVAGLHGANGTQTFDLPITVVSLNDLSMLAGENKGTYLAAGGGSVDALVAWTASTASGPVFGTACAWSVSDSSVQIANLEPNDKLDRVPTGSLVFKMTNAGSFTATCTLGHLTVIIPLKRDS